MPYTLCQCPSKDTPFGALFDDTSTHPKAPGFQANFLRQLSALLTDDLMGIALPTANRFNAGQSPENKELDYPVHLSNGTGDFVQAIQEQLRRLGNDLTPKQLVNRALTQSCAGCHQLSARRDLGHGLTWPLSRGFVHVDEDGYISPALRDVFLPHRQAVLQAFLNRTAFPAAAMPRSTPEGTGQTIGGPNRTH